MDSSEAPYQIEKQDGFFVLTLYPLINDGQWANVAQVGTEILGRLEAFPDSAVIIDLSPLQYMGSAQIALLVRIWKSLKRLDGRMVVQVPGATVREILNIAGLHALWTIVPTRSEALAALSLPEPAPAQHAPLFRQVPVLAATSLAGLVVSAALACWTVPSNRVLLSLEWLAAAAALAIGLAAVFRHAQRWRWISAASAVLALLVLASATFKLAARTEIHEAAQDRVPGSRVPFELEETVAPGPIAPGPIAPRVASEAGDPEKQVAGKSQLP